MIFEGGVGAEVGEGVEVLRLPILLGGGRGGGEAVVSMYV